jgi:hypothetical protein
MEILEETMFQLRINIRLRKQMIIEHSKNAMGSSEIENRLHDIEVKQRDLQLMINQMAIWNQHMDQYIASLNLPHLG